MFLDRVQGAESELERFENMKMCRALCSIAALTLLAISQPLAKAQALSDSSAPSQSQTKAVTTQRSSRPFSSRLASLDLDATGSHSDQQ